MNSSKSSNKFFIKNPNITAWQDPSKGDGEGQGESREKQRSKLYIRNFSNGIFMKDISFATSQHQNPYPYNFSLRNQIPLQTLYQNKSFRRNKLSSLRSISCSKQRNEIRSMLESKTRIGFNRKEGIKHNKTENNICCQGSGINNKGELNLKKAFSFLNIDIKDDDEHNMKKQILKELMEINKIPANYFLFGKESKQARINININGLVDLVNIYTNTEGDIIIRPNQPLNVTMLKKDSASPKMQSKKSIGVRFIKHKQVKTMIGEYKKSPLVKLPIKPLVIKPKIKQWHAIDKHLHNHKVNVTFRLINNLFLLLTKMRLENTLEHQNELLSISKKLDMNIKRKMINESECFKESIGIIKEMTLRVLFNTINASNQYIAVQIKCPKYFIGNGNNHLLVKSVIRQRSWWSPSEFMSNANLVWTQWKKNKLINSLPITDTNEDKKNCRMCNHLEGNFHLANKKGMYYNLKYYYEAIGKDPFNVMPLTFHIKEGINDKEYEKFLEEYHKIELNTSQENIWIIKPGENSNRGNGISLARGLEKINKLLSDQGYQTYILQKYIEQPLLFGKRKFDIRCYGLLTSTNGHTKGYFYNEGYLRTASKDFSLKLISSRIVHLTNEAIQKKYSEFGKYESGNKLTYTDLQKYLEVTYSDLDINFNRDFLPQIKALITDTFRATHGKLDPLKRKHTFEVFGYDFMIDKDFHIYLIEVNTNPCLEIMSPVTARILPTMLDNTFRIAVDPIFQPSNDPTAKRTANETLPEIKHELVYDSDIDGPVLEELMKINTVPEVKDDIESDDGTELYY